MSGEWMEIEHGRVGTLRVAAADLIHFDGIPGFPDARRFALVGDDRTPRFAWLACVDDLSLALPVTALRDSAPEHYARLGPPQLASVAARDLEQVEVFAVVNLRRRPPTLQVDAPLLVNVGTRRGAQVLLPPAPAEARELVAAVEAPELEPPAPSPPRPQIESKPQT